MSKSNTLIDTNEYFIDIVDDSKSTIGYTVINPEKLLAEIIKQNKHLSRKIQECRELEIKNATLQNRYQQIAGATLEAGCYRKALEEIEEVWTKDKTGDYDCIKWQILDIISKVKDNINETTETT